MLRKKNVLLIDWLLNMLFYTFILGIMAKLFKNTIQIDNSSYGIWFFIVAIIIYILNKTIKPLIAWITLPITMITLGLFYPFINVIILKIADFILGNHFDTGNIFMTCLVAILIGLFTLFMDNIIINPLLGRK